MTQEELALLAYKGILSDATPEEKEQVDKAYAAIKAAVDEHGQAGGVALIMHMLELAAEESKKK